MGSQPWENPQTFYWSISHKTLGTNELDRWAEFDLPQEPQCLGIVTSTVALSCWLPSSQLTQSWFWVGQAAEPLCPVAVGTPPWLSQLTDHHPTSSPQNSLPSVKINFFLMQINHYRKWHQLPLTILQTGSQDWCDGARNRTPNTLILFPKKFERV
jgi:hypothetical protein